MPDSHVHIRTLFKSRLLRVLDYRCAGDADGEQEIPQGFEIVLPRSGAYQRRDAHGTFLADPNQVLFYNQGEPYDITHPVKGGDASTVFLFAPTLLAEMIQPYDPHAANDPRRPFRRSHITLRAGLQILQYQLLRTPPSNGDPLETEEQMIATLGEILHAVYRGQTRAVNRPSRSTLSVHAGQVHAVKIFLNTHLRESLQLEQIASAAHLSPYHLCRIFKQNTGFTLHQYLKRLRLFNAAQQMLDEPAARLDLLALEYGFSNHGNFSTAFRQAFGVNPSQLRSAQLRAMSRILKA